MTSLNSRPSEWTFDRFVRIWTHASMTTFAYWLCAVERRASLPPSDVLASEMSVRYEIEDQVIDPNGFDEIQSIVSTPLLPIIPITLASSEWYSISYVR